MHAVQTAGCAAAPRRSTLCRPLAARPHRGARRWADRVHPRLPRRRTRLDVLKQSSRWSSVRNDPPTCLLWNCARRGGGRRRARRGWRECDRSRLEPTTPFIRADDSIRFDSGSRRTRPETRRQLSRTTRASLLELETVPARTLRGTTARRSSRRAGRRRGTHRGGPARGRRERVAWRRRSRGTACSACGC